jgi:hypothetical protein
LGQKRASRKLRISSPSAESFDAAWKIKVRRFRANYWNLAGFTFMISANLEAIFFVGRLGRFS